METSDNDYRTENQNDKFSGNSRHSGRMMAGLVVVAAGCVFLAREMGVDFPHWLFTWPVLLIAIGFFIGAKHSFRRGGWFIPIIVGSVFLIDELSPGLAFHQYIWPVAVIAIGLLMILRPRRKKNESRWSNWEGGYPYAARTSTEDFIDSVSVFGGNKKNLISKDFKGGDIVIFFGGMELNLSQADLAGPTVLEITQVFGGTKLIVPSNWKIKSEVVTVFGAFEDKRQLTKEAPEENKILKLQGTCIFGGIDVKSY